MEADSVKHPAEPTQADYLGRVARADQRARLVLSDRPELDYSLLLHTFLCLDLTPAERLRTCLQRYGYCRL